MVAALVVALSGCPEFGKTGTDLDHDEAQKLCHDDPTYQYEDGSKDREGYDYCVRQKYEELQRIVERYYVASAAGPAPQGQSPQNCGTLSVVHRIKRCNIFPQSPTARQRTAPLGCSIPLQRRISPWERAALQEADSSALPVPRQTRTRDRRGR